MGRQRDQQFDALVLRHGRSVTFAAALAYAVAAHVARVPETLLTLSIGMVLVVPIVARDRLLGFVPSLRNDFAVALIAPFVTLAAGTLVGLPFGRVLAAAAGMSLTLSAWFALRRAAGSYGERAY